MSNATVQTALCVIPPEGVWSQIQAIRSQHDRAFPRWMPHINFIYPFVSGSQFSQVKQRLDPILNRQKPFSIRFDSTSFHYFQQQKNQCTFHLRPTESQNITELYQLIANHLPTLSAKNRPFEAHLTLGQTKLTELERQLQQFKDQWTPIEFLVDRVCLISREDDPEKPFVVKEEIFLLGQEDTSMASAIDDSSKNRLYIGTPRGYLNPFVRLFEKSSFLPCRQCRLNVAEYDDQPTIDPSIRSQLESISKFFVQFSPQSLNFNEKTSELCLRAMNLDQYHFYDNLLLGSLDRQDFDELNERYKNHWQSTWTDFEVDRFTLVDRQDRTKFVFRLKSKSN